MEWQQVTVDSVSKVVTKGTTPTSIGLNFSQQGIPFLRVNNIQNGTLHYDDVLFIDDDTNDVLARSRIHSRDVLLSIAGTIGRSAVVPDDAPQMNCNQAVAIIRLNDKVDPYYFRYWLDSSDAVRQITGSKVTATISNLSLGCIRELLVPLPSIAEQRRIAEILDRADAVRRKRQAAIALTEELLRSTFLEMFGDPVRNPKRWETKFFGDVGTLDRGRSKHRPRNDSALLGGIYPLIQTGDVSNCNGLIQTYTQTYSEQGLAQSKMWKAGTLCITIAANIAKTGILAFDACFPDSIVGFHAGSEVAVEYVQGWLRFLQPILEDLAPQSAQKNINLQILRELELPVPPIDLQKQYSQFVLQLRQSLRHLDSYLCLGDDLFNSLLQRAFRGEL